MLIRVGSRGSRLALTQADLAAARLRAPGIEIALVPITTAGDRDRTRPFGEIGARGVFVKELEEALLDGRIDVAVHSAKDMTSTDTDGLVVGAYLEREDPRDALCGADEMRPGMRIGTASIRRRAQLLAREPSLSIEPLRGNIDTRLRKRGERGLDAIVLAACGLDRLGLAQEIGKRFEPEELVPEAGQGALALQVRAGENHLVAAADDAETRRRVEAERACVAAIGGGCLAPVAAHHDGTTLTALVAAEDGSWIERRSGDDPAALAAELLAVRPLRVLVTRPSDQADPLVTALADRGFDVVVEPLIRVEPLSDDPIDVSGYEWVVVTSPNGARELARRMEGRTREHRRNRAGNSGCARGGGSDSEPRRGSPHAGGTRSRARRQARPPALRRCRGSAQPARRRLPRRLSHCRARRRRAARRRPRAAALAVGRSRLRASRRQGAGDLDRAADDAPRRAPRASSSSAKRSRTTCRDS